jgi:hypothetical protein
MAGSGHVVTEYGLTMSTDTSEVIAFKERDTIRGKIVINNKIMEQVNVFIYEIWYYMRKEKI